MTTQTQTDVLEGLYSFRNRAEIMAFLDRHPALVPVLQEAHTQIGLYFPGAPISLEYRADPDIADYDLIGVYVDAPDDSTTDVTFATFRAAWGLAAYRRTQGKMLVDVE